MLRITKKERQKIYNINARIRNKIKKIKTTFNIDVNFDILSPKQFTSRKEVNLYKEQAKTFLNPYTHRYVKMGIRRGGQYFYGVPYEEYRDVMKKIKRQNAYAKREMRRASGLSLHTGQRKQDMTSGQFIEQKRKNITLRSPHQQFFEIKLEKERIKDLKQWNRFRYAIESFHTSKKYKKINLQARDNYVTALLNTFGDNALPIADILMSFTHEEFLQLYESNTLIDFDYVYSYDYAMSQLIDIAKGIMKFIGDGGLKQEIDFEMADKIVNLGSIMNLDSAQILSQYNLHSRKFTYNGAMYQGSYRQRELEMIDKGDISDNILKKSRYLGMRNNGN